MKLKFRHHRGSLKDSLATSVEFNSSKELEDYLIVNEINFTKIGAILFYGYDPRCKQMLNVVINQDNITVGFIYVTGVPVPELMHAESNKIKWNEEDGLTDIENSNRGYPKFNCQGNIVWHENNNK